MLINKIILTLILVHSYAFAGTIKQVKNSKALLTLDGKPAKVGDQFYGIDENNKKTSLLEITVVKDDQAVAKIIKGTPQPNDKTEAKTAVFTSALARPVAPSFFRHDLVKIAVNFKYMMDSISSKQEDGSVPAIAEDVTMKGNNIGFNASLDYPLWSWLGLRVYAGYEILKVTGTATNNVCDGRTTTNCNVDVSYLSAGALARFTYRFETHELWFGAGAGLKQPLSKKSTALKEDSIALANTAIIAFGFDYHLSNKYFIPASFEYHKSFNESPAEVPAINNMGLVIGFGLMF